MPECSTELPRFRGWTCADRNGRSNEQAAAAARAVGGRQGDAEGALGSFVAAETVVRSVFGDELTVRAKATLGLGTKELFTLLLTVVGGLACCGLCIVSSLCRTLCRALCVKSRRAKALAKARKGSVRVAGAELDDGGSEDEILGDE
jgi:hypothetical protein